MLLKELRVKYKLTQKELCKITGVKLSTLRAWEQGKRALSKSSMKTLLPLVHYFGKEFLKIID